MIHEKLSKMQATLKAPKGQFNSFGKYKYRSCEDIVESVKPLLSEAGVSLVMSDDVVMCGDRVYIKATVQISDGKESIYATAFAREPLDKKGMDASQITGTASSYARKYALNGLFAIDDTKDADTDEHHNSTQSSVARQPVKRINKKAVQEYIAAFVNAIANEDGLAMRQMGDELKDTPEHDAVWQALDSQQKAEVKRVLHEMKQSA